MSFQIVPAAAGCCCPCVMSLLEKENLCPASVPSSPPHCPLMSVWHLRGQVKPILVLCVKGID